MAQTSKGSGTKSRSSGKKRSTSSKSSGSRAKSSSARSRSTASTKRKAAPKKGGQARARQQKAKKAGGASRVDVSGKSVAELREVLTKGVFAPLNLVMLTRDRMEEVFDDAVKRGRMTGDDAQNLVGQLLQRGRKQTNDVMRDLEQLLGRGGEAVADARKRGRSAAKRSRTRARVVADPVLATADRARRAAGVGPSFPILG
jgi:polyhydroxyalkanoate synthesis regulator phasin